MGNALACAAANAYLIYLKPLIMHPSKAIENISTALGHSTVTRRHARFVFKGAIGASLSSVDQTRHAGFATTLYCR